AIEERDKSAAGKPQAQGILAREVTKLVHGAEGLAAAERITEALFSGDLSKLTEADFAQLALDGLPTTKKPIAGLSLVDALVSTGLASSNRAAREFIGNGAVNVNGEKVSDPAAAIDPVQAMHGRYFLLRRGKKQFHLLQAE